MAGTIWAVESASAEAAGGARAAEPSAAEIARKLGITAAEAEELRSLAPRGTPRVSGRAAEAPPMALGGGPSDEEWIEQNVASVLQACGKACAGSRAAASRAQARRELTALCAGDCASIAPDILAVEANSLVDELVAEYCNGPAKRCADQAAAEAREFACVLQGCVVGAQIGEAGSFTALCPSEYCDFDPDCIKVQGRGSSTDRAAANAGETEVCGLRPLEPRPCPGAMDWGSKYVRTIRGTRYYRMYGTNDYHCFRTIMKCTVKVVAGGGLMAYGAGIGLGKCRAIGPPVPNTMASLDSLAVLSGVTKVYSPFGFLFATSRWCKALFKYGVCTPVTTVPVGTSGLFPYSP